MNEYQKKKVDEIANEICDYFNVTEKNIINMDRREAPLNAKTFLWYILHYELYLSIKTISKIYLRDPRSICRGVARIREGMKNQPYYRIIYSNLMKRISPIIPSDMQKFLE